MTATKSLRPAKAPRCLPLFERVLVDAENEFGVSITVHDLGGSFVSPEGVPLLGPRRQSHKPWPVCDASFCKRCTDHCGRVLNTKAATSERPFVSGCWNGVLEVVVPIRRRTSHVATIFVGAWRRKTGRGSERRTTSRIARSLPVYDEPRCARIGRMMQVIGGGLVQAVDDMHSSDETGTRRGTIMRYIRHNAAGPASLSGLASSLHLSPSRSSHLVRELLGRSFKESLKLERVKRARLLLVATDDTVAEIGRRVGVPNEYFFSRMFRSVVGVFPGKYRTSPRM